VKGKKDDTIEKNQWIKEKKIIDSEEDSEESENEIIASQVGKLNLDE